MLLLKNGYVVEPGSQKEGLADIMIKEDVIAGVYFYADGAQQWEQSEEIEEVELNGAIVGPGLVDVHVHFRDPGFTEKEDIYSGAKAAAKGGVTTVVLMANTDPKVDNVNTLQEVLTKGKETDIRVETCANVTVNMAGKELVNFKELLQAGAVGFTDDGVPLLKEEIAREAMVAAKELDVVLSFHEEDNALIATPGINKGKASEYYGIGGSPREAEITMVERDVNLALEIGAKINIQHISSKEAVDIIRQGRAKGGDNLHAEATPHHFSLTEEAAIAYGTMAKMNPPLREEADRLAIIKGLQDGTIDMIATDHAPHLPAEKAKELTKAPSGILGLETALSLGYEHLVKTGDLSWMQLFEKMSYNPANLYKLQGGYVAEGGVADLVIFAPDEAWEAKEFLSKSQNSPFLGQTMQGKVKYTICKGKIIYRDK